MQQLLADPQIKVLAVIESTRIKRVDTSAINDVFAILRLSGFRYAVYLAWVTSVYNILGNVLGLPTLRRQCRERHIPVLASDNINNANGLAFVRSQLAKHTETIILTAMFNQKLSPELLSIDDVCFINVHPGKLPDYRGVDPVLIAMRDNQPSSEVSIHQTALEFDCGDIIASESLVIDYSRSLFWHQYQLFELGAKLVCQWVRENTDAGLREALNKAQPQQGRGQYFSWPVRSDMPSSGGLISWRDIKTLFFGR